MEKVAGYTQLPLPDSYSFVTQQLNFWKIVINLYSAFQSLCRLIT